MSDELRYLASLHNAAVGGAPFLGVAGPRNDAAGPSPSKIGSMAAALAPTIQPPPPLPADAFRALPHHHHHPGLPPPQPPSINYFGGPGLAGPPLDLKHDHLSGALAQSQPMLPPFYYDPCFPSPFPYHDRFGGHLDINGARRKNATRETTAALKSWLFEHRKNPYPTKGEKIFLAIVTKMTLTQVSTWFANARRRLKKENKMTWSPRNRSGEDDDDLDDDDDIVDNNNNDQTTSSGDRAAGASSAHDKEHNHRSGGGDRPLSSQSSLLLNDSEHSDAEISPRNDNNFHSQDYQRGGFSNGTTAAIAVSTVDRTAAVSPISSTKSSSPIISKPSIKDATCRTTPPPKQKP